jgi:DNA-binding winged helix-turn-helix (wHTH) protein
MFFLRQYPLAGKKGKLAAPQHLVRFGPYRFDEAIGQLWCHTQVVRLPPKAVAVLWCLVSQAGQVVTKDMLLKAVWAETAVSESVLSVCIRNLRRVLGDDAKQPCYIETVHRREYRFIAPVVSLVPPGLEPGDAPLQDLPASPSPPAPRAWWAATRRWHRCRRA